PHGAFQLDLAALSFPLELQTQKDGYQTITSRLDEAPKEGSVLTIKLSTVAGTVCPAPVMLTRPISHEGSTWTYRTDDLSALPMR
ncbi:MAG TPA: hypothetical protein VFM84_09170, partial [Holophagaceae bacterium]|nr:hypothetical protein [Holophagaceae bacterium]